MLTLNLKCTSTSQSMRMARIFSLMSVCTPRMLVQGSLPGLCSKSRLHQPYLLCHVAGGHPEERLDPAVVAVDLPNILCSCTVVQVVIRV